MFVEKIRKTTLELFLSSVAPFNFDGNGATVLDMYLDDEQAAESIVVKFLSDGREKTVVLSDFEVYFPNLIEELQASGWPIKNINSLTKLLSTDWRVFLSTRVKDYNKYCDQYLKKTYIQEKTSYKQEAKTTTLMGL